MHSIVVTGIGLVSPLGVTAEESWKSLLQGCCGIRPIDRFAAERYPSSRAGLVDLDRLSLPEGSSPRIVESSTRMVLAAAREALRSARLEDKTLCSDTRTAVILGSTLGGMPGATRYVRELTSRGNDRARASWLREMLCHTQAQILADTWGLRGEVLTFSDACTSGTNSLGHALHLLRHGDADRVVAGGFDPLSEFSFAGFHSLQAIASGECRPFDRNRKGLVLGEGAAILILERQDDALRRGVRPLAVLAGYGESADAFHITRPDPSARGAALALRRALEDARVTPDDVGHINAHGTGTPSNDPMEAEAIRKVFGERSRRLPLTANKAAIGHTLGASGSIEAVFTLLALRDQIIPPTLHHETLDPACEGLDIVTGAARSCTFNCAISNSFGFGGSNAAIVFTLP